MSGVCDVCGRPGAVIEFKIDDTGIGHGIPPEVPLYACPEHALAIRRANDANDAGGDAPTWLQSLVDMAIARFRAGRGSLTVYEVWYRSNDATAFRLLTAASEEEALARAQAYCPQGDGYVYSISRSGPTATALGGVGTTHKGAAIDAEHERA